MDDNAARFGFNGFHLPPIFHVMRATVADLRRTSRHAVSLPATIKNLDEPQSTDVELHATAISFGTSGCALRTTSRLAPDANYLVTLHLKLESAPRSIMIPASVVWERDDFRI